MKIKKPSLKGMKDTKYLGHFAQDKYIQKGHNLSGVLPMTQQVQMAAGTATNPFDYQAERQKRIDYQKSESLAQGQALKQQSNALYNVNREASFQLGREATPLLQDPTGEKGLNKKKFIDII
jgi:hypothetical protein